MSNTTAEPTEEDFQEATRLAEELRRKLPLEFTTKGRVTPSGEREVLHYKADPAIPGLFHGYKVRIKDQYREERRQEIEHDIERLKTEKIITSGRCTSDEERRHFENMYENRIRELRAKLTNHS
jgi:hypothetical protein